LDVYKFLLDWQTLAAGLLALLGAWLTVRQIRRQIAQVDTAAEALRKRSETAAKAVLPLALSEVSGYASRCMLLLGKLIETPGTKISSDCSAPALPQEVISTLQDCVRYANDDIQKKIAVLLGKIQVQRARLIYYIETNRGEEAPIGEGAERIIDAADVYACNDTIYSYGRDIEGVRERASPEKLYSAFSLVTHWSDDHPGLERINALAKRLASKDASN
jgi:hypothetical protein